MRRTFLNLSLLALLAAPLAAHAASFDLLTLSNPSTPTVAVFQFILPAAPVSPTAGANSFTLNILPTLSPTADTCVTACHSMIFWDAASAGGVEYDDFSINVIGPQLFSGSLSAPTFVLQSTPTLLAAGFPGAVAYDYTITSYAAPTPEPSSLMLLGTGALGLVGSFRRRLSA